MTKLVTDWKGQRSNRPGAAATARGATQEVQTPMSDQRTTEPFDDPTDDSWAVDPHVCGVTGCSDEAVVQFRQLAAPTTTVWACRKHRSLFLTRPLGAFEPSWEEIA